MKKQSSFFPRRVIKRACRNASTYPWAKAIRKRIVGAAAPWMRFSDDRLWALMFGPAITRSWMVWSDGRCPACRKRVPMYTWEIDALKRPWKVRCPHCTELFPKNDFRKFHDSGLDRNGVFDPKRANRALLYNTEHPGTGDPKRGFGVDDGEGYRDGRRRWRFIGAYLVYGQWKQAVLNGIEHLSAAYVVTGDPRYAHKTGILLDRVADLYPTFDYRKQGLVYEGRSGAGYVSIWHDACRETRDLVIAYDRVFDALRANKELVAFLAANARAHELPNPKASFADIQRNIEGRILRDALAHRGHGHGDDKIATNKPNTEIAVAIIHTVLGWPGNRSVVLKEIVGIVDRFTQVDGLTGEKGLSGYAAIGPRSLGLLLEAYATVNPSFLKDVLRHCPQLHKTYRFHIDTWCLDQRYYPQCGDTGAFAQPELEYRTRYRGVEFMRPGKGKTSSSASCTPNLTPSMFSFLWRLYEITGDRDFVKVLYHGNDGALDGLPHDLFAKDPTAFRRKVMGVIDRVGPDLEPRSVNKRQWRLAILRAGTGTRARALWLDYDSGMGGHSHRDGMNLGLFAEGLDLMPDFGYPPVQFGGWKSARANWYKRTAAHNTVVVDGRDQREAGGKTTLWADGRMFGAIRASCAAMIGGGQYERTAVLIDLPNGGCYVVDVFRVVGGTDHARFMHSHFGTVTTEGLKLGPTEAFGHNTIMRDFQSDPRPRPGWHVDWRVRDRYGFLPKDAGVHLRYTDLTRGAEACLARAWVVAGGFNSGKQAWIPRVMVRRRARNAPLASTFVAVIEPYSTRPAIEAIRRLPLCAEGGERQSDANVALEIRLADGRRDLITALDVENPLRRPTTRVPGATVIQRARKMRFDGELCFVRRAQAGGIERIALCRGTGLQVGDVSVKMKKSVGFVEVSLEGSTARVVSGNPRQVAKIMRPEDAAPNR